MKWLRRGVQSNGSHAELLICASGKGKENDCFALAPILVLIPYTSALAAAAVRYPAGSASNAGLLRFPCGVMHKQGHPYMQPRKLCLQRLPISKL